MGKIDVVIKSFVRWVTSFCDIASNTLCCRIQCLSSVYKVRENWGVLSVQPGVRHNRRQFQGGNATIRRYSIGWSSKSWTKCKGYLSSCLSVHPSRRHFRDTTWRNCISDCDDVPAYLKVSRDCRDVKDNIDNVDYKEESLRLLFAKKGQITLSKFSIPPLTASTSSWFIGIAIKNASGDTPIDARKTVTLTLKRSFDYTCTKPFLILF